MFDSLKIKNLLEIRNCKLKIISHSIAVSFILIILPGIAIFAKTQRTVFPVPVLETYIESSFAPNSVLETSTIKFKFSGKNLTNVKDKVSFEAILFPVEKNWARIYGDSKTYSNLKRGNYIFLARAAKKYAKTTIYDKTPALFFFQLNISDYYKKVSLDSGYSGKQLSLSNYSKEAVNITGWKIKSLFGEWTIQKAARFVEPSLFSNESDIILQPNEKAVIKAGTSTIGFNFMPNRCFSFLPQFYRRDVYVSGYCGFSQDEIYNFRRVNFLSDKCVNFVVSNSCKTPNSKEMKKIQNDNSCVNFVLQNLNYKSCYEKHRVDLNFLSRDWRIYINTAGFHYSKADTIKILDKDGFLVAEKKIY